MIIVSDTSPLNYLVLIGAEHVLPELYGSVAIPQSVRDELAAPGAPEAVRTWMDSPPSWLVIHQDWGGPVSPDLVRLHQGEREAIRLASYLRADLVLLDERAARTAARERGHKVIGLLSLIDAAAVRGLVDVIMVVDVLRQTTFRATPELLKNLIERHQR